MPVLTTIVGPELLVVLAIIVVLSGSSKLPRLARSLGSFRSELERGRRGGDEPAS